MTITLSDPVENLQLENAKDVYFPGESLKISAVGRPEPKYFWQNLVDNTTLDGSVLNITESMEGTQNWAYIAYNDIRGERYELTKSHNFFVEIKMSESSLN